MERLWTSLVKELHFFLLQFFLTYKMGAELNSRSWCYIIFKKHYPCSSSFNYKQYQF